MSDPVVPPADAPATPVTPPETPTTPVTPPADAPAPVVYELKAPEGSKLDAARIEAVVSWAKDKKVAPDLAQEILNREAAHEASQAADYAKQVETWKTELQNDKEFGGDNLPKNVELAQRVVKKFGSESFQKALDDSGLGNHPELVKVFAKIGKAIGEDNIVLPGSTPAGPKDLRDVFYPKA